MTNGGDALMAGLRKVRDCVELCDCKIISGTRVINAHKIILMMHSDYFKAAWKPNTFKEGDSGIINLEDDDPEMVELMVSYFYDLTYSCGDTTDNANNPNDSTAVASDKHIITHAKMFVLAVKYQAKELRHFAKCSFRYATQTAWDSDAFPEAVEIVLNSTPEDVTDLRHIVFDLLNDNLAVFMNKPEINELVHNHPDLAYEVLMRQTDSSHQIAEIFESECVVCHQTREHMASSPGLPKMCMQCNSGNPDTMW